MYFILKIGLGKHSIREEVCCWYLRYFLVGWLPRVGGCLVDTSIIVSCKTLQAF